MHYPNDITGFISELKGGGTTTASGLTSSASGLLMSAAAAANAPSFRQSRSELSGLAPCFPTFSGALSSSAGPVGRAFSVLRPPTGEASLGSFNNALHPIQPSLSADPPIHSQPVPPRGPPSPIPHLHHSSFANNSSYHPFASLTHLNHAPSSLPTQANNYSPHPPSTSAPMPSAQPVQQPQPPTHNLPSQNPPPQNISPCTMASQHNPIPPLHAQQPSQPIHMPQPSQPPVLVANRPPPPFEPPNLVSAQMYAACAAPHPQSHPVNQSVNPSFQRKDPTASASQKPVSSGAASAVTSIPMSSDGHSQIVEGKRRANSAPSKRARARERQSQHSPTTPRSTVAGTAWSGQTGYSGKAKLNPEASGHSSALAEEQSRPERKREREKRRRETMNTRFNELAACLVISAGGKSDKESILAEAVDYVKKQSVTIEELSKQNQEFQSEARDLRAEKSELRLDKNYLREERDRYKQELEELKVELKRKRHKISGKEEPNFAKRDEIVKHEDEMIEMRTEVQG